MQCCASLPCTNHSNARLVIQASESALGKTEFENDAQHLYSWGSVAFGQSTGVMLPYNLQKSV